MDADASLCLLHDIAGICCRADGRSSLAARALDRLCDRTIWTTGRVLLIVNPDENPALLSSHTPGARKATFDPCSTDHASRLARAAIENADTRHEMIDQHTLLAVALKIDHRAIGAILLSSAGEHKAGDRAELVAESAAGYLAAALARRSHDQAVSDAATEVKARIGRELHDSIGQNLTGLVLRGHNLADRLETHGISEADTARDIFTMLSECVSQLRYVVRDLTPVELTEAFSDALRRLAANITDLHPVHCSYSGPDVTLPPDRATHLFQIAREAVRNAIQHAAPGRIEISCDVQADTLQLSIRDDGSGIATNRGVSTGSGMTIMSHRASAVGGTLSVEPNKDRGTTVLCTIPH